MSEIETPAGPGQCCNKCICTEPHSSVPPVELE